MKIGDRVYIRGHVDEIRKDMVIVRNKGGYFGTVSSEIIVATEADDVVSVVRCKDCKHSHIEGNTTKYRWCKGLNVAINDDDYCSYAERRKP